MITASAPAVVKDPSGLVRVCAWCVTRAQRLALKLQGHVVTDGICATCQARFEAGARPA